MGLKCILDWKAELVSHWAEHVLNFVWKKGMNYLLGVNRTITSLLSQRHGDRVQMKLVLFGLK